VNTEPNPSLAVRHGQPWLDQLFDAIDSADTAAFLSFLSDDAIFIFGSAPPVSGQADIGAAVSGFFASIKGCKHQLSGIWQQPGSLVCEGTVHYQRHDGSGITLPFANVFELEGRHIQRYSIYIDISPLYAGA
jgi:hypothetical protein